jgi:hypothetical protein
MTVVPPADGYAVDEALPGVDVLPVGTNLLLVGNESTGAVTATYRLLASAPRYQESVVLMTTDRAAAAHIAAYRSELADPDGLDHLFLVDGSRSGPERDAGPLSPANVEAASSPADVTGLGVGLTNHLRSIGDGRARLGLLSLSPVVDRLGTEKAFAFFHVLTSRVRQAGLLGLFVVDPTRHEAKHVRILQSLVDGSLRFRLADDGRRQFRGRGAVDAVSAWTDVD